MNEYEKMLIEEIKKQNWDSDANARFFVAEFKKYGKAVVNGRRTSRTKPEWQTPEENRIYTLAVLAELRRKYRDQVTVNLDVVPGEVTLKDLRVLEQDGAIEIWRVAAPYQLVFCY